MILSDIMQLPIFTSIYLVAGVRGIAKDVKKVAVLDYEIMEDVKSKVFPGDLLLTTFTPARGDVKMVEDTIKALIETNVAGIAMKKVFFPELPQSVIDLANEHGFPIFLFDEGIYFEDIITQVAIAIHLESSGKLIQRKIHTLLHDPIDDLLSRSYLRELSPLTKAYGFIRIEENYPHHTSALGITLEDSHVEVLKYRDLMITVISASSSHKGLDDIYQILRQRPSQNTQGFSQVGHLKASFQRMMKEAFYAYQEAKRLEVSQLAFSDLGIHQLILPHADTPWFKNFYNQYLSPLENYDQKYQQELVETFRVYFTNHENIKATADQLFTHPNTIRFRIKRGFSLYDKPVSHELKMVFAMMDYMK